MLEVVTKYSELRVLDAASLSIVVPLVASRVFEHWNVPRNVTLSAGDKVTFSTRFAEGTGTVLSIDAGAVFPIKLEWFTPHGDKFIASYEPSEFISLDKVVA